MGQPNFEWNKIPLLKKMDNKNLEIKINDSDGKEIKGGFSLNVGNPHVIFFVEDFNLFNLKEIGPKIENHNYFPEKCNVTLAKIKNTKHVNIEFKEGLLNIDWKENNNIYMTGAVSKVKKIIVNI